ncbi:hypothetical protein CLU93_0514 [Janthinobacterium sp. 35]|uniref:hypothetical protein n=1 Tax=Janthinobacterium sp. 35 TaxID=2035210 RepID=UPI000C3F6FBE|nr:hypothetical protein [Janthinobacterium sp. 35]PIG26318.1 hypothetical protein CLU93_0514 [Janthinobacterium sp. 35]
MKTLRKIITILVIMLCIGFPFAQASTISHTTTYLGSVQWRYDRFAIAFDYLAGGTPGGQLFTVSDPPHAQYY